MAQADYLDGRIYLHDGAYTQARVSFTRANRKAGTGELAEKSRYFLALTDFYAGDFEFATIQLKTLGRKIPLTMPMMPCNSDYGFKKVPISTQLM